MFPVPDRRPSLRRVERVWWRSVEVAAPVDDVWAVLTDTRTWPTWGPTVSDVRLDHPLTRIHADSTGAVRTPVGVWAPFVVTGWAVDDDRRSWSWRVAGIPATSHEIEVVAAGSPGCGSEPRCGRRRTFPCSTSVSTGSGGSPRTARYLETRAPALGPWSPRPGRCRRARR